MSPIITFAWKYKQFLLSDDVVPIYGEQLFDELRSSGVTNIPSGIVLVFETIYIGAVSFKIKRI